MQRFAQDVVAPRVRDMDENEMMDPEVIKGLFETGVRISCSRLLVFFALIFTPDILAYGG